MANLRILVPDATTNYITNPSIQFDTTGWTLTGPSSDFIRDTDHARFGFSSLRVEGAGGVDDGVSFRVSSLSGVQGPVTASVYLRGAQDVFPTKKNRVRLRLIVNPTGKEYSTKAVNLPSDRWIRLVVTGTLIGSNDVRLIVENATGTATDIAFYLDGAQLELKHYATTYCDGDQPGCRWNLVAHGSTSSRDAFTREGGKWVALAGPCRSDNDIYVTVLGGLGMAPLLNNIQSWANAPGSYFQNVKVLNRIVTLSFHAKNEDFRLIGAPKLDKLHELRQQLIDIIKPDLTQGGQAFLFEYDEGERPLYMRFRYEAGLEGEWDVRNQWVNSFPLRLLAVDPFWTEDNQNVGDLDFTDTIPSPGGAEIDAFSRVNGVWTSIKNAAGTVPSNAVLCAAIGPKGEIYLGGSFTNIGNRIVKWDGTGFTEVGTGGANGIVRGIAVAPNGDAYAVGDFTSIGGVAANRVAKYTAATGTWSALSSGFNASGHAVCIAPNGQVYFGGEMTTAGGITVNYICRWDGTQFRTVGAPTGLNNFVRAIVNAGDGATLYIGGDFTAPSSGAGSYTRLASISLTTNLLTAISGFNASVYALAVGKDGILYCGGSFTTQGAAPTGVRKRVAYIQGGTSNQLGDGFANGVVYGLAVAPDGILYAVGSFTLSGTLPTARLARWTKGAWNALDLIPAKVTASPVVYSILAHPNGDLYAGADDITSNSYISGITTITNEGTAEVQPTIYVLGPGILRFLENWTTKKRVYFNLTLFSGEEVYIDFARASITSTQRGNLMGYVLNGSDFKSFSLLPGDNQIAAFMTDDVGGLMKISYVPQHWSADAVVDAEALV